MPPVDAAVRFAALEARWQRVAAAYLPVRAEGSPWRFSDGDPRGLDRDGWKLHLSATILTAAALLRRAGPVLAKRRAVFKGPPDLVFLARLNRGIPGFSQVGKCLTVYCPDADTAVRLAFELDDAVGALAGPVVPYDLRLHPTSAVYYRYGAFGDGGRDTITGPRGGRARDRREPGRAVPAWIQDPFTTRPRPPQPLSPLATDYRAYRVLRARGKGGVYLGLDITRAPAQVCVIKEGRRHGETDPYGRDGRWLTRHEGRLLGRLRRQGVPVPRVIAAFDVEENHYLVLEQVVGPTLAEHLAARPRRRDADARLGAGLLDLLARMHASGVAWRDCKPDNLIVTPGGLVAVDFEGGWRRGLRLTSPWGTAPFLAPVPGRDDEARPFAEDIFSAGVVLEHLARPHRALRAAWTDLCAKMTDPVADARPGIEAARRLLVKA